MQLQQAPRLPSIAKLAAPDTLLVIPSEVEESLDTMSNDRKSLEERAQMTDIERLRHSASHVLATAIFCHSEPRKSSGSRMERLGKPRHGQAGREAERAGASESNLSIYV